MKVSHFGVGHFGPSSCSSVRRQGQGTFGLFLVTMETSPTRRFLVQTSQLCQVRFPQTQLRGPSRAIPAAGVSTQTTRCPASKQECHWLTAHPREPERCRCDPEGVPAPAPRSRTRRGAGVGCWRGGCSVDPALPATPGSSQSRGGLLPAERCGVGQPSSSSSVFPL